MRTNRTRTGAGGSARTEIAAVTQADNTAAQMLQRLWCPDTRPRRICEWDANAIFISPKAFPPLDDFTSSSRDSSARRFESREPLLLRDDLELERRRHVAQKLGGDVERSRRANVIGKGQALAIDLDAFLFEGRGNVFGSDRSEEAVFLADLALEPHHDAGDLVGLSRGFGAGFGCACRGDALRVLDLLHVLDGGGHRERTWEQVVARVAGTHAHEIAALAQVFQ